jgi:hypothetical protein
MAAHKGPASLRPRCTQSGNSVAAIPAYPSLPGLTLKNSKCCSCYIYLSCMDLRFNSDFWLLAIQHEQICFFMVEVESIWCFVQWVIKKQTCFVFQGLNRHMHMYNGDYCHLECNSLLAEKVLWGWLWTWTFLCSTSFTGPSGLPVVTSLCIWLYVLCASV